MKRTILITIAALCAVSCARPVYVASSDAASEHLRGPVARISQRTWDSHTSGAPDTLGFRRRGAARDARLALQAIADPSALAAPDTTRMIGAAADVIAYNPSGNITRHDRYGTPGGPLAATHTYIYDPTGTRLLSATSFNPQRNSYTTTEYQYNAQGRLVGQSTPLSGTDRTVYTLDRRGYRRTATTLDAGDSVRYRTVSRYDLRGRLRQVRTVHGRGPLQRFGYHPGTATVSRERVGRNEILLYAPHGALVAETHMVRVIPPDGGRSQMIPFTMTADYTFDDRGNWIVRVRRYRGVIQNVAVRQIEYRDVEGADR